MGFPFRRVFTCVIKGKLKPRSCSCQLRQAVESLDVSLVETVEDSRLRRDLSRDLEPVLPLHAHGGSLPELFQT